MHSQLFSNKTRGFYPVGSLRVYKDAGTLPDDLVRITDDEHQQYIGEAPNNCVPNYNTETGTMEWLEVIPPTQSDEAIVAANLSEQKARQRVVAAAAFPLQSAAAVGATAEEQAHLDELQAYSVALHRINLLDPDWPVPPDWL